MLNLRHNMPDIHLISLTGSKLSNLSVKTWLEAGEDTG
jgi:hypothetical protein